MRNYTILDVRTSEEHANGRIKESVNIPLNTLIDKIGDIQELPQPVFVYCHSGIRSAQAVAILNSNPEMNIDAKDVGGIESARVFFEKLENHKDNKT